MGDYVGNMTQHAKIQFKLIAPVYCIPRGIKLQNVSALPQKNQKWHE